jgi:4-hydroxy-3-methylbut-2-enyl diphosphate reductase
VEVVVAKSAGFCYGVKRALDIVDKTARSSQSLVFTLGPLIHNPQVIAKLEDSGVKSVSNLEDVPSGSTIIMPTHGTTTEVLSHARELGLKVVDATCPFVRKVHQLAEMLVQEGYQIIVLGDKDHSEVRGIMSRAGEKAVTLTDLDELAEVELEERVGILAQTTQSPERYERLVNAVSQQVEDVRAFNTICSATLERQKDALTLAQECDAVVVVGGRNSANTRRLAEICAQTGVPTYQVEIAEELNPLWFRKMRKIGVTAGASTPDWIIESVRKKLLEILSLEA